jgi:hypothetical protein
MPSEDSRVHWDSNSQSGSSLGSAVINVHYKLFDAYKCPLKIQGSIGTLIPKVGVRLGVRGFIPSHFPKLPRAWMWLPNFTLGLHFCKPFALVAGPRLGLRHQPFLFGFLENANPHGYKSLRFHSSSGDTVLNI